MTRRTFALLAVLILGSTGAATQAPDISGKWTGTLTLSRDGQQRNDMAFMVFTQMGTKLTGTAGPSEDRQRPIANGTVEGTKVTFDILADGPPMAFTVTLTEGRLKGQASGSRDGQPVTAAVDVGRVK